VGLEHTWLENAAGPLLLLPDSLLPAWSGIDVPEFRVVEARFRWSDREERACDYDRACDVDDYVGVVRVGHGEGLVLGDVPAATAWLPRPFGGFFARWEYAESEVQMNAVLEHIPEWLAWVDKGPFVIVSSPLQLFNSAEPGLEVVMSRIPVDLAEGTYNVRWARYAPNDSTALSLIELRRASI
jgi:hypothetical protein